MKLTAGINFTNILLKNFSNESDLHSVSLVTFWLCNFLANRILVQKILLELNLYNSPTMGYNMGNNYLI